MRVGLVIYGSLETLTGGYLYDRKLVEHLRAHGDEVEVVSLPWRGYGRHLADNAARSLRTRLGGRRYNVLVQDELNHPSLVLTNRRLRRDGGCPIVSIVHILRVDERPDARLGAMYAAVERRYLRGVDAAVFSCSAVRASAEALVRGPLRGVVARPCADHLGPAADEGDIRRRARTDGPLRIVSVANVVPRKGLHVLLEALRRLPAKLWRLTVAGSLTIEPRYVRGIRRAVNEGGLEDRVDLLGAIDPERLPALLAAHDVLAVPSTAEGLAIAYLEAMHCGLPVIATAAGGAGEIVEHGREGWLVAPGDAAVIAHHLGRLTGDRELLARMGVAARRRIDDHPSWQASLAPVRELLASLAADSPRRGAPRGCASTGGQAHDHQ